MANSRSTPDELDDAEAKRRTHEAKSRTTMSDKPAKITPIRPHRQAQLPRQVDWCPHGIPLDRDCAECHGIKPDDKGEDALPAVQT